MWDEQNGCFYQQDKKGNKCYLVHFPPKTNFLPKEVWPSFIMSGATFKTENGLEKAYSSVYTVQQLHVPEQTRKSKKRLNLDDDLENMVVLKNSKRVIWCPR